MSHAVAAFVGHAIVFVVLGGLASFIRARHHWCGILFFISLVLDQMVGVLVFGLYYVIIIIGLADLTAKVAILNFVPLIAALVTAHYFGRRYLRKLATKETRDAVLGIFLGDRLARTQHQLVDTLVSKSDWKDRMRAVIVALPSRHQKQIEGHINRNHPADAVGRIIELRGINFAKRLVR